LTRRKTDGPTGKQALVHLERVKSHRNFVRGMKFGRKDLNERSGGKYPNSWRWQV
jgi:hypothetical protein